MGPIELWPNQSSQANSIATSPPCKMQFNTNNNRSSTCCSSDFSLTVTGLVLDKYSKTSKFSFCLPLSVDPRLQSYQIYQNFRAFSAEHWQLSCKN